MTKMMPDALAGLAASAAIQLSDFPFECPISEVSCTSERRIYHQSQPSAIRRLRYRHDHGSLCRFGNDGRRRNGRMQKKKWWTPSNFAHEAIKDQIDAQIKLADAFGRKEVREYDQAEENEELQKQITCCLRSVLCHCQKGTGKAERSLAFSELKEEIKATFSEEELEENGDLISKYFGKAQKEAVRELVLSEGLRLDGRKTDEIRPIWCEVDYLPSTTVLPYLHGRDTSPSHRNIGYFERKPIKLICLPMKERSVLFALQLPPFCTEKPVH